MVYLESPSSTSDMVIIGGDASSDFTVNHQGELRTAKTLDHERFAEYNLHIVAVDNHYYAETFVNIIINDIDDNQPAFSRETITVDVFEDAPVHQVICVSSATDPDVGANAQITYISSNIPHHFSLDQHLGTISVAQSLLDSPEREFEFTVYANSLQGPFVNILVRVIDVNNHTPTFDHTIYHESVNESVPVNTIFFNFTVTDDDYGINSEVSYTILSGNTNNDFGIFPGGSVYVAKSLDRETRSTYVLTVQVTDHGSAPRRDQTTLVIYVLDANDNKPVFTNISYHMSLFENSDVNSYVGTVRAVDRDLGRNAEILYRIDGSPGFSINPISGVIRALKTFDREAVIAETGFDYLTLYVTASDNAHLQLSSRTVVFVQIDDVNDNFPSFRSAVYEKAVLENADIGTFVLNVTAHDPDSALNSVLAYFVDENNGDDYFHVDQHTGVVTVARTLDREKSDKHIFVVTVSDGGNHLANATCLVIVTVSDVNDNTPQFVGDYPTLYLDESEPVPSSLVQFTALDADIISDVHYSISNHASPTPFTLDENTGQLFLTRPLDYETTTSYTLNVRAIDSVSAHIGNVETYPYSELQYQIVVRDINDNTPVFTTLFNGDIMENMPVQTPVVTVNARDLDSSDNGNIRYYIRKQQPAGTHFHINENTGLIMSSKVIDYEQETEYRLTVVAEDQATNPTDRLSSETIVVILVHDTNDNKPEFAMSSAIAVQHARNGDMIAVISATDADSNQAVEYTLDAQYSFVRLDSRTGENNAQLILQDSSQITDTTREINIEARNPSSNQHSTETFTLFYVPSSNNGPSFDSSSYIGSVSEDDPIGTSILTVGIRSNQGYQYFITASTDDQGNQNNCFAIDRNSGRITNKKELIGYDDVEEFTLEVYAVIYRPTPQHKTTEVRIQLRGINNNAPVFPSDVIDLTVSESHRPGEMIDVVTATDIDGDDITYQITRGDISTFSIRPNNGQLDLVSSPGLDRETTSLYVLTIQATDRGSIHTSTTTLSITVTDVNDNSPEFVERCYSFDVLENAPPATTIGRVFAQDEDEGVNSDVTYSLVTSAGRDKFDLHRETGVFTLIGSLDYEQYEQYVLTVSAKDRSGGQGARSSTVSVYINVVDVNDNTPLFDPSSYSTQQSEDITPGTSVIAVSATDQDTGSNGVVVYSIVGGNDDGNFAIDPHTGEVRVIGPLDRETQPRYNLAVMARDSPTHGQRALTTTAMVTINLRDSNDNPPVFTYAGPVIVSEGPGAGGDTTFYTFTTTDLDLGVAGQVQYHLATTNTNSHRYFSVTSAGDLQLRRGVSLDRENPPPSDDLQLEVVATDGGSPPLSSTITVQVEIGDINDNAPRFITTGAELTTTVSEAQGIGTRLFSLEASDADIGVNGEIRFVITGGDDNGDFWVDSHLGDVYIQKRLDYERINHYELQVEARDMGNPSLSDVITLQIDLTDVNDVTPRFVDAPYVIKVEEETSELPLLLKTLVASDDDSRRSGQVVYSIQEGNEHGTFQINAVTGELMLTTPLDREERDQYHLIMQVMDKGSPRLTGTTSIHVIVEDQNDHAPMFQQDRFTASVLENRLPNTDDSDNSPDGNGDDNGRNGNASGVITITAHDQDTGDNSKITYHLLDATTQAESTVFSINADTGNIRCVEELDREAQAEYLLLVTATDNGLLRQTSTATLLVYVLDENDNDPKFIQDNFNVVVNQGVQSGDFVAGVTAVDLDDGDNGEVHYEIISDGGGRGGSFTIDPQTGVITATQTLQTTSYTITVRATDRGSPSRSDTATVHVTVERRSNNLPRLTVTPTPRNTVSESVGAGHLITSIEATAAVPGASVTYHIAGGNVGSAFLMLSNGELVTTDNIDYELMTSYTLWLEARSTGTQARALYHSIQITITDENDNAPIFDNSFYNSTVVEDLGSQQGAEQSVTYVSATDRDSGNNGLVRYRLSAQTTDAVRAVFEVDPNTGHVRTIGHLDREEQDMYVLLIEAYDQGSPSLSAVAVVQVHVVDQNDHQPRFTQHFNALVYENIPIGFTVLKITSMDADIGQNAVATYSLRENTGSMFAIDSLTGALTVARELDYETRVSHILRVEANDGVYNAATSITVDLLDANDNAPVFTAPSYTFNAREGHQAGELIGTVQATDDDSDGDNSLLFYSWKEPTRLILINGDTGALTSTETLMFGNNNEIHLTAVATDRGEPALSGEVAVVIRIHPQNRHAPQFIMSTTDFYADINSDSGTVVATIIAVDEDDMDNTIEYTITSGVAQWSNYFTLDRQTGELTTTSRLHPRNDIYDLTVRAQDSGKPSRATSTTITVRIVQSNTHTPRFTTTVREISISEDTSLTSSIMLFTAVDDDDAGVNSDIRYSIYEGNTGNKFTVDETSGALWLVSPLDYESTQQYTLTVMAQDMAPTSKSATFNLVVTVQDVNDNPPVFNEESYTVTVDENHDVDSRIIQLATTDLDLSPEFREVTYHIISVDNGDFNAFEIGRDTGEIIYKGGFNYEQVRSYNLEVKALNPGTTLSSTIPVSIIVTDYNENAPVCENDIYYFSISESSPLGVYIGSISATDADHGTAGKPLYYIIESDVSQSFTLDPLSGNMTMSSRIDRESIDGNNIMLDVLVKNEGSATCDNTDKCRVVIEVNDANDPPRFTQARYGGVLPEDAEYGTSVLQVSAVDYDSQQMYRDFTYHITDHQAQALFTVNESNGWVTLIGALDRETQDSHSFAVLAIDSGTPPRTGTTTVEVQVTDVNDQAPYFRGDAVTSIAENGEEMLFVANLGPITDDNDLGVNRGPYRYQLLSFTDMFTIVESSGLVRARIALDREQRDKYLLPIRVSDSGIPTMTSTLTFTVNIADENDNPPRPRDLDINLFMYNGRYSGGVIGDVKPLDDDIHGDYDCVLDRNPNNMFSFQSGCQLTVSQVSSVLDDMTVPVTGEEALFESVQYDIHISYHTFTQDTIDNSVVITFNGLTADDFLTNAYDSFMDTLSTSLPDKQAIVYSIYTYHSATHLVLALQQGNRYVSRSQVVSDIQNLQTALHVSDIDYNPCLDEPCRNAAVCDYNLQLFPDQTSIVDSPHRILSGQTVQQQIICTCSAEFTGQFCESHVNQCTSDPCRNGGQCRQTSNSFVCDCGDYWTGPTCEEDVNECESSNPCLHGGQCDNTLGSYECHCVTPYTGRNCELEQNYCSSAPCEHDSVCSVVGTGSGYQCDCKPGDRGNNCEVMSRSFDSLSYAEYNVQLAGESNSIVLELSTYHDNLLVMYVAFGNDQFIAIEVIGGQVYLSYRVDSGAPASLTVTKKVNDGHWYRVSAMRSYNQAELRVSSCPQGRHSCSSCQTSDSSCYKRITTTEKHLSNSLNTRVNVGGVSSLPSLFTQQDNWIRSHDFIGCLRDLKIDGVKVFDLTVEDSSGISYHCTSRDPATICDDSSLCGDHGTCVPHYNHYRCVCHQDYTGMDCMTEKKPISFGANSVVRYTQSEAYTRDHLMSSARRRRSSLSAAQQRTASLQFRTTQDKAVLMYFASENEYTQIQIRSGTIEYRSHVNNVFTTVSSEQIVSDNQWYNVIVSIQGSAILLDVDGISVSKTTDNPIHDMLGDDLETISLGQGSNTLGQDLGHITEGFTGCVSDFLLDGAVMPYSGATERFDIQTLGDVTSDCPAVPVTSSGGLHVAIIIVIVLILVIILVVVAVLGIVYWRRHKSKAAKKEDTGGNANGRVVQDGNKSNASTLSKPSIGNQIDGKFTDNEINGYIQKNMAQELATGNYQEREVKERPFLSRPDIIAPESSSSVHPEDNSAIVDRAHVHHGHDNMGYHYEPAEHYDIENASSIAPSDMDDVVLHYKNYRNRYPIQANDIKPRNYNHPHRRQSPSPLVPLSRQDIINMRNNGGLPRGGPPYYPSTSSPLTVQGPPHQSRSRTPNGMSRPGTAMQHHNAARDKAASPLHVGSLRSTPVGGLYTPGSNASNSSASFVERPVSVPVGFVSGPPGHHRRNKSNPQQQQQQQMMPPFGANHRMNHGLSLEEVQRMNAHRSLSPVSTLDAVSSSSGAQQMYRHPRGTGVGAAYQYTQAEQAQLAVAAAGLEPGDTSSDEGGSGDSFTCSEFEYEPERTRAASNKQQFARLTKVSENDSETDLYRPHSRAAADGSDSNRDGSFTTFATSDEDQQYNRQHLLHRPQSAASKLLNGTAFNWDYLLNWGPNFEKLVGVFNDIAELPDAGGNHMRMASPHRMSSPMQMSSPSRMSSPPSRNDSPRSPTASITYESSAREEYV